MTKPPLNQILQGHVLDMLGNIPKCSVSCIITSPPYWGLRAYGTEPQDWDGWRGELGSEPTIELYIDHLILVFGECKRVLRPDGTLWVNIGDTYCNAKGKAKNPGGRVGPNTCFHSKHKEAGVIPLKRLNISEAKAQGLQDKSLCGIPERFVLAMLERGWIRRNTIIWHKPNPMPSSAKDRFTVDFEYVYFFVKSKRYFFEPIYAPYTKPLNRYGGDTKKITDNLKGENNPYESAHRERDMRPNPLGRNKRTVWTICTEPCPEAHFATFPHKLIVPMIEAGCPKQICSKCGLPRKKIYEPGEFIQTGGKRKKETPGLSESQKKVAAGYKAKVEAKVSICGCWDGQEPVWLPGVVLDPFLGSGTAAVVAHELGRDWLGIELSPKYVKIAQKRIKTQTDKYSLLEPQED